MSKPRNNAKHNVSFERINPYFNVQDISASIKFYLDVLGFELYVETPKMGIIERDGHQIHLSNHGNDDAAHRIWVGVSDVDVLIEQFKENGAIMVEELINYS